MWDRIELIMNIEGVRNALIESLSNSKPSVTRSFARERVYLHDAISFLLQYRKERRKKSKVRSHRQG